MRDFFQNIQERLDRGEWVALAVIVSQKGSTPRDAGTMMALFTDGSLAGTIGGGSAEAEVIRAGRTLLEGGTTRRASRYFSMTDGASASSMGMVCGGEIGVCVVRLEPQDRALVQAVLGHIDREVLCFLAFPLQDDLPEEGPVMLVDVEHGLGDLDYAFLQVRAGIPPCPMTIRAREREWFVCPATGAPKVYFFGAGHVSRATAEIAALAGFAPVVVDDRQEIARPDLFPFARAVYCVPSFNDCVCRFSLGRSDLVVIASRIPLLDRTLLEQVLATPAGFVGMLGSTRKRAAIFADLLAQGVRQEDLDRVHSPLGVSIGARTPQEIGVSIVAELIRVRRTGI
jgi:xanthine dehydrogenase accessory factor